MAKYRRKHRPINVAAREAKFSYTGRCIITNKVIFPNRKIAKQNRKFYHDPSSRPYKCVHCKGIHLGHPGEYSRQQHREWHQTS